MRGNKAGLITAVVAAILGQVASPFSRRRPYDGFVGKSALRQWHDPARVAAADAKRARRQERNLRNAAREAQSLADRDARLADHQRYVVSLKAA